MDDDQADRLQRVLNQLMLPRNRNRLCAPVIAAAPVSLDAQSYFLLITLARRGPLSAAQAADAIGIDRSGTSRYADRLSREGLLFREPDAADRRASLLSLTPEGRRLAAELNEVLARNVRSMIGSWPEDRLNVLIEGIELLLGES
ncbi:MULTISPECIES: MarR family winged helix-turn-helix transcriptional regulator [Amycolatopsis]|uniref:DNA-binding transcriptional regulator, MarR family n=1 Tax=Amycolatopsis sacchari TaxID=115433 RepID=A0A1I3WHH6_9PSEU|nr:MarR family transcriptional regulator [Amycolatopsis sacchari]SFK06840.1 DNA-binding transcriptional regulator, MarR family [Amycolatopsis sacchari]